MVRFIYTGMLLSTVLLMSGNSWDLCLDTTFHRLPSYANKRITEGILWSTIQPHLSACLHECYEDRLCLSVQYSDTTGVCEGLGDKYDGQTPSTAPQPAVQLYESLKVPPPIVRSCSDVRTAETTAVDGEYWISPISFTGGQRVKIYCHDMANDPVSYVSLPALNYGSVPGVRSDDCVNELPLNPTVADQEGNVTYTKIAVNITTMTVITSDQTFATGTGYQLRYGVAGDCYHEHTSDVAWSDEPFPCGPKGVFHINLTGTGLVISSGVTWEGWAGYSNMAVLTRRVNNGRSVEIRCGGNCGGCVPSTLILEPDI